MRVVMLTKIIKFAARRSQIIRHGKTAFLGAVILALALSYSSVSAESNVEKAISNIKISIKTDSEKVIIHQVTKPNIVVGESNFDRENREAREKEERAKQVVRDSMAREKSRVKTTPNLSLNSIYRAAAIKWLGDESKWIYLDSIHKHETGYRTVPGIRSSMGAGGPMQFIAGTWRVAGDDGDGDGIKDRDNYVDAIYGAAKYLAMCGGKEDMRKALYSYNHVISYVNKVEAYAKGLQ